MKLVAPDYYEKFSCIANKCKHNCCIGWEIDIDDFTLTYYETVKGEMGERLKNSISYEGDSPHFSLGEKERCPFLNKDNLCDIIAELSEDALCDICADHPRFRNYFSDRTEIGLGLCCESAAKLILQNTDKVNLIVLDNDGYREEKGGESERKLEKLRKRLFDIIQNRERSIEERISLMLDCTGAERPQITAAQWAEIYLSLERLRESWSDILNQLKEASEEDLILKDEKKWELPFEQLLHYFTFRHIAGAVDDGRLRERVLFAAESVCFIGWLCAVFEKKNKHFSIEDMTEIARMFSSEVEYSDENMERLLEFYKESLFKN